MNENLYQAFLERTYRLGYTAVEYESKEQPIEFFKGREYICSLMPDGNIHFKSSSGVEDDVHKLTNIFLEMKPVYDLYANASCLRCDGIKNYKLLCEFGDYLLAATLTENSELSFVTWHYEYNRESVGLGHYFGTNYEAAMQSFATRCGLVDKNKLFSEKELSVLYDTCVFRGSNDHFGNYESEKEFQKLTEKLESLIPDSHIQEPEQEHETELEV